MALRLLATLALGALALAFPAPAFAHHGTAAVGVAGPEGPGAALETTSPLPLPQGSVFTFVKSEYVAFERRAAATPENKAYSTFSTAALGYGLTPWLSAYAFLPWSVKAQDAVGTNAGLGDPSVMLALGLALDGGLRLVPEKESLDELEDWHLGAWVSSTVPVGSTVARDDAGLYLAPDMQTGFGAPSPAAGVAVLKQVAPSVTWLAEASYQHFFPRTYRFTRYQFGGETRLASAVVWRVHGAGPFRLDLTGELTGLHLQRDRERDEGGALRPLQASGGAILYAGAGVRASWRALSVGLGVKRAALAALNERAEQQGSEGLEALRAALTIGYTTRP